MIRRAVAEMRFAPSSKGVIRGDDTASDRRLDHLTDTEAVLSRIDTGGNE